MKAGEHIEQERHGVRLECKERDGVYVPVHATVADPARCARWLNRHPDVLMGVVDAMNDESCGIRRLTSAECVDITGDDYVG